MNSNMNSVNRPYVTFADEAGARDVILVDRGHRLITSLEVPTMGNEIDYWERTSSLSISSQATLDGEPLYPIDTPLGGVAAEAFTLFR